MDLSFENAEDFGTPAHQARRSDGWLGGPFVELPYFLSCLTRTNYYGSSPKIWEPELRQFIAKRLPQAKWITGSSYFYEFAVLLIKDLYRCSPLGKRHPIGVEKNRDTAVRFAILHPQLSIERMAEALGTTVKQLQRNSYVHLAIREYK
jgi:hypothetical protein